MLRFKIDVLKTLKEKGYNTTTIRKDSLLSEGALQQIRKGVVPGTKSIDKICTLLKCQPGKIIEWVPGKDQE